MINQRLYFQIVLRVLLIVVLALGAGVTIAMDAPDFITALCLFFVVPVTMNLISFLNTANREMSRFLHSIQNNDSILSYQTHYDNKSFQEFYEGLNKLNRQIQSLKLENENREHYFEILLEHVDTGIITFKKGGKVMHANSAAKRLLSFDQLQHLDQLDQISENFSKVLMSLRPSETKLVTISTKNGTTDLSIKAGSLTSGYEDLKLLSLRDIGMELDEKEQDSWIKLIRVIMHEMMNSITPITTLSEGLSRYLTHEGQLSRPAEIDENIIKKLSQGLNVINEQGKGLMNFVESYRQLSRMPLPEKTSFRVRKLFSRIKILYNSLENSKRTKLMISVNPSEMELFADENMISQVLLNLIKNAIQATREASEGLIQLEAKKLPGELAEIKITDNGIGIPPENLEQIFIPFFTTNPNGSGIGLNLSRQIMRLHGGRIQVHSIPKKETVFTLTFPDSQPAQDIQE